MEYEEQQALGGGWRTTPVRVGGDSSVRCQYHGVTHGRTSMKPAYDLSPSGLRSSSERWQRNVSTRRAYPAVTGYPSARHPQLPCTRLWPLPGVDLHRPVRSMEDMCTCTTSPGSSRCWHTTRPTHRQKSNCTCSMPALSHLAEALRKVRLFDYEPYPLE